MKGRKDVSGTTLRIIIAGVICFHGIGHLMGVIPALGLFKISESSPSALKNWSSRSWLLTDLLGDGVASVVCAILFAVGFVGFVGAGLGLLGWLVPHAWWRTLAIVSAVVSLVAVALFWNALMLFFPHKVGALGVDTAILVGLLVANWPTEAAIGF
jgi:hypothetical protein